MASYVSPYRNNSGLLPPGYMAAATDPGRNIAAGITAAAEGIAKGIERHRTEKSLGKAAETFMESLPENERGIDIEAFKNLSARDKASRVQGLMMAEGYKKGRDDLLTALQSRQSMRNRDKEDALMGAAGRTHMANQDDQGATRTYQEVLNSIENRRSSKTRDEEMLRTGRSTREHMSNQDALGQKRHDEDVLNGNANRNYIAKQVETLIENQTNSRRVREKETEEDKRVQAFSEEMIERLQPQNPSGASEPTKPLDFDEMLKARAKHGLLDHKGTDQLLDTLSKHQYYTGKDGGVAGLTGTISEVPGHPDKQFGWMSSKSGQFLNVPGSVNPEDTEIPEGHTTWTDPTTGKMKLVRLPSERAPSATTAYTQGRIDKAAGKLQQLEALKERGVKMVNVDKEGDYVEGKWYTNDDGIDDLIKEKTALLKNLQIELDAAAPKRPASTKKGKDAPAGKAAAAPSLFDQYQKFRQGGK